MIISVISISCNYPYPSLKVSARLLSGTRGKRSSTATQCHQTQAGLSVATMYAYPALDLAVTNVPANDMYRLPLDFCFAKPGHDDDLSS